MKIQPIKSKHARPYLVLVLGLMAFFCNAQIISETPKEEKNDKNQVEIISVDDINKDSIKNSIYGGLEAIVEGGKMGWRLKGMLHQAEVGLWAVDLGRRVTASSWKRISGNFSFTVGHWALSSGKASTVMGDDSSAKGDNSVAIGSGINSNGLNSIAIGDGVRSLGNYSFALGHLSGADSFYSTSIGYFSYTKGNYSTAIGTGCTTKSFYSTSIGKSLISNGNPTEWIPEDPLLVVANTVNIDVESGQLNGLTILKNANMGITTPTPITKLQITKREQDSISIKKHGFMVIGTTTLDHMVFNQYGIAIRNNGNPTSLHFQKDGGSLFVGGTLAHISDRRLKKDIQELQYGLDEMITLRPKSYTWKNQENTKRSMGLIAQDVQKIIPELVSEAQNNQHTLSLNYTELIPILIKILKEQQHMLKAYQDEIAYLSKAQEHYPQEISDLSKQFQSLQKRINNLKN